MKLQVVKYWNRVRSSFWFVPGLMAIAAVVLALGGVALDEPLTKWFSDQFGWEFMTSAEGATAVLGNIAGSMINIAGVVFSMTLVALSLASSQLGPRLLRNFMRDTSTQVVLGTFVATFVYCLLVLRTIRRAEEAAFVPHLSIGFGVVLAVASVGVLIYFIHHVSVSIQANEIAARIGRELLSKVDELYPAKGERISAEAPDEGFLETFEKDAKAIRSPRNGYLQLIDKSQLVLLATQGDFVVRLEQKPGNFVVSGCPLVSLSPGDKIDKELEARIQALFVMDDQRTTHQDLEFAVNQLVEMAVRALSPGINDPFTAIACVDHLGAALCRLAARDMPNPNYYDDNQKLRLFASERTFEEVLDSAFNQIRQYGISSAAVLIRLLETIAVILEFVHRPEDKAALLRHADMVVRGAREGLPEVVDRQQVEAQRLLI